MEKFFKFIKKIYSKKLIEKFSKQIVHEISFKYYLNPLVTYVASREAFDSVETREIRWILDEWKCRVIIRCGCSSMFVEDANEVC